MFALITPAVMRYLRRITRSGHEDVAAYLLDKGADVESYGYAGMRALHHACSNSHEGCITLLLERGADPNAVDEFGEDNSSFLMLLYFEALPVGQKYAVGIRGVTISLDRLLSYCLPVLYMKYCQVILPYTMRLVEVC